MKLLSKTIIMFFLVFSLSCTSDDAPKILGVGTITGEDFRECSCCGGWFIDIGKQTFRFYKIPNKTIDLTTETFPLKVKLHWSIDAEGCLDDLIIVNSIAKL